MRELKTAELTTVSGGAFNFLDSAKGFYNFLRSEKNPLNGTVIGKTISGAIGNIMYPMINSVITVLSSFIRK
ncbi:MULTISPECIES: hypothetical protein [Serratia]|uniref:Uncharacterized protein n=1 Tax=Serratia fonticola TaxID=47917 RepID=A0AAE7JV88_SERFO|nr:MULTISPECIES: hypothetical protein [Serratia]MDK2376546.1 hypothetical protein [Serratia fonticola]QKJ60789.1 hypothetical protein G9399_24020 [Serratia fonticola]